MKYLIIILDVFIINKRLLDTIAGDFKRGGTMGVAIAEILLITLIRLYNIVDSFYISLFYLHSLIRLYNS